MASSDPKEQPKKQNDDIEMVSKSDFLATMKMVVDAIREQADSPRKEAALYEAERLMLEQKRMSLEMERVAREMPENKTAPGISVYSHPEGDYAHPKTPLKCKMLWCGYEETLDTLTPLEGDLLNRMEPGEYKVTKTDGSKIPFRVTAKRNDRFELEELAFSFRCSGSDKHNHGSKVSYLRQALGDYIPSQEELIAELARLKAELEAARVGAGRV